MMLHSEPRHVPNLGKVWEWPDLMHTASPIFQVSHFCQSPTLMLHSEILQHIFKKATCISNYLPNVTIHNVTDQLTDWLAPWMIVYIKELPVPQLDRKLPTLYENQSFITVFERARYLSPSWPRLIESLPHHPISLKIHFNYIYA